MRLPAQIARANCVVTGALPSKPFANPLARRLLNAAAMRSMILSALLIASITACVATDDVSTQRIESALEDPCTADKIEFKNYEAATACAKSRPTLFHLVVGAMVKAGATCTAVDETRACTSIEPIRDDETQRMIFWPTSCTPPVCPGDPIAGLGYCEGTCCYRGVNGEFCLSGRVAR